ncbi:MAG: cupredoxin domain-containing protein [Dehalococcoidia bacterium]
MEYIQTILLQVPASQLERASQAGGLLAELDAHREFLRGQPGFRDIRITRSINNEGNILVLVETRWADDATLVRYETNEPNAAAIVRAHQDIIVRDSLQVLDMEALRTEASFKTSEEAMHARERVMLPIAIPLGVLAFVLLAVYGLSRIYLEIGGDGAVALGAGLTIGVLIFAFYFVSNPRASGMQIAGVMAIVALALAGGTTWALVEEDEHAEEPSGGEPPDGEPGNGPGGGPSAPTIVLGELFFEYDGEQNPEIPVTAGEEVVFTLDNDGTSVHNMHVAALDGTFADNICDTGGDATACSDPDRIAAGESGEITINIADPGTYDFRCDFHAVDMTGTLVIE